MRHSSWSIAADELDQKAKCALNDCRHCLTVAHCRPVVAAAGCAASAPVEVRLYIPLFLGTPHEHDRAGVNEAILLHRELDLDCANLSHTLRRKTVAGTLYECSLGRGYVPA